MNILSVAYPLLPVGPDSAGGAEQILSLIERGLASAGHTSIVIAAPGSRTAGELIESAAAEGEITEDAREQAQEVHRERIRQVLERLSIDLIHFHGLDFHTYLPTGTVPLLATLHLPVSLYPAWIFDEPKLNLNCVSQTQASSLPGVRKPAIIFNGIETERYRDVASKRDFFLVLTRICPEKGVHTALEIAHHLDLHLLVAGPVHAFSYHQRYFSERIQPLLDHKRRYVGPVGFSEKRELLSEARGVLIPSLVAETSSLVAMEAISSGTPVIAFRSGALAEVVEDGRTGFIADSQDEMAEAIARIDDISAETCRSEASVRFDARRMVADYINLYRSLL